MTTEFLVHIVDDDFAVRDSLVELLDSVCIKAVGYESADAFLAEHNQAMAGCLVLDIRMPGMSGLELQKNLQEIGSTLPIIFITGHADVPMAIEAIKHGAIEFIQKPFRDQELLDCIHTTMEYAKQSYDKNIEKKLVLDNLNSLTAREKEALELVSEGHPNKVIASMMGISQRTVENHRAKLLEKMNVKSTAALIKVLLLANSSQ
ncbi:response regulator transcription factor [uncultured Cocleimonas sp.]|uniref:response regulator transcription factor n=1 Tax=uncultured Cocleimonas sp. TaxID=1051587 RepID=UPI00261E5257|nr:response regulator [uncultured Cocleimonas sp.]